MTPLTNTYQYRAYIETLPSYGTDAKITQLTRQLWHKDTATRVDAVEIDDGAAANAAFVARRANTVRSRVVDMIGRLHVDLFLQDKFLIHGIDVKIRLVESKNAFALMGGGANPAYEINVINANLVCKEDHPESVRADGAHQGPREENGQVSDAACRLQGVLHSRGRPIAHAREPVPRHPAETSGAVLHR